MREAVSDILVDRAREADGLTGMFVWSLLLHGLLIAGIVVAPDSWRTTRVENTPVMTITLGGSPGPQAGGMTPIAGRPVQQVAPPESRPSPVAPPAAKPPEMVVPEPTAKPAPKTPPKPVQKPDEASARRKPTTGAEIQSGSSRVDTGGAPIPFGGLTTGGGGAGGARVDVANFCCPAYLVTMTDLIRRNWNQNQGVSANVEIRFTIHRNGTITDTVVEKPSPFPHLDREAIRALVKTRVLPPLPREFTNNTLTVYLIFDYKQ